MTQGSEFGHSDPLPKMEKDRASSNSGLSSAQLTITWRPTGAKKAKLGLGRLKNDGHVTSHFTLLKNAGFLGPSTTHILPDPGVRHLSITLKAGLMASFPMERSNDFPVAPMVGARFWSPKLRAPTVTKPWWVPNLKTGVKFSTLAGLRYI